jgi:transposase
LSQQCLSERKELERRYLYNQGLSDTEISVQLFVNRSTIERWRIKNNLPSHVLKGNHLPKEEEQKRIDLYNQGLNDYQISKILNYNYGIIRSWRKKRGLPANRSTRRPSQS